MTPYFQDDKFTIYCADFRDIAADLGRFDAVIADPPYQETSLKWDRWPAGWVDCAAPRANVLWCFGSFRMFRERHADFEAWSFAQDIIWEKHNGSSSAADRFRRVHEIAVQYYLGPWEEIYRSPVMTMDATARTLRRKSRPPHWGDIGAQSYESKDGGPRLMRSVIPVRSCHGTAIHKTQKPEGIVRPLLQYSVPPGGRILSPFLGSGTDLVVARELGFFGVGVEASEEMCEKAVKRIQEPILAL